MSEPLPDPTADVRAPELPPVSSAADALRVEIFRRFQRSSSGLGDQALRSAVLAYLAGARK